MTREPLDGRHVRKLTRLRRIAGERARRNGSDVYWNAVFIPATSLYSMRGADLQIFRTMLEVCDHGARKAKPSLGRVGFTLTRGGLTDVIELNAAYVQP